MIHSIISNGNKIAFITCAWITYRFCLICIADSYNKYTYVCIYIFEFRYFHAVRLLFTFWHISIFRYDERVKSSEKETKNTRGKRADVFYCIISTGREYCSCTCSCELWRECVGNRFRIKNIYKSMPSRIDRSAKRVTCVVD